MLQAILVGLAPWLLALGPLLLPATARALPGRLVVVTGDAALGQALARSLRPHFSGTVAVGGAEAGALQLGLSEAARGGWLVSLSLDAATRVERTLRPVRAPSRFDLAEAVAIGLDDMLAALARQARREPVPAAAPAQVPPPAPATPPALAPRPAPRPPPAALGLLGAGAGLLLGGIGLGARVLDLRAQVEAAPGMRFDRDLDAQGRSLGGAAVALDVIGGVLLGAGGVWTLVWHLRRRPSAAHSGAPAPTAAAAR